MAKKEQTYVNEEIKWMVDRWFQTKDILTNADYEMLKEMTYHHRHLSIGTRVPQVKE
jgi:hypothetical protein